MNTTIKAVFFDIGGTLVEKTKYVERDVGIITEMIRLLDITCPVDEFLEMVYRGEKRYKEGRDRTLNELPVTEKWAKYFLAELDENLVRPHAGRLQQLWSASKSRKRIKSYASVILNEIHDRGYTLGTISHSTPRYLDEPGLEDLFQLKLHAPEFGKRKPHPSLFVDAARQCGLHLWECAYVGDHPWRDVVGPREAGYGLIVLLRNGSNELELRAEMMQPDIAIDDLRELLDYLPRRVGTEANLISSTVSEMLYDVAFSTSWWDREVLSADEFFETGRRAGFARFELNHQIPPEVMDEIDTNRFSIGSLHDPCPAFIPAKQLERTDVQITSLDEELRRRGVDVLKSTIDQAYCLRARHVVVHPGRITGDHSMDEQLRGLYRAGEKGSEKYEALRVKALSDRASRAAAHFDQLMLSLREITAFAEGSGLSIGLENRFHFYELPDYSEMRRILEEFQQPWLGWQFDVGHLQVLSQLGLFDFSAWLEAFSSRIVGVHLHDVVGIVDHQIPGSGEVDFVKIASHLPADAYRAVEVDKNTRRENLASGLQYLAQVGCVEKL